jgi:SAM-dependent methyltransferase
MRRTGNREVNGSAEPCTATAERLVAERHFAVVASRYESLRDTDEEPVCDVRDRLPAGPLVGIDVGAGTGRYTERLVGLLGDRASVFAADRSLPMLLVQRDGRPGDHTTVCGEAERLPIAAGSVDFVTTFNAVHHFDLDRFVQEAARLLAPGGHLFIYTRTPEQNARSVWGRAFPGFTSREDRLYGEVTLRRSLRPLGAVDMTSYSFSRRATPARLAARVRGHAYSTFALYEPHELEAALECFLQAVNGRDEVCWQDHNLLVHVQRR